MRAAFRLWVTELRPKWIARWHGCAATHFDVDDQSEEDCVLLAELTVPILSSSSGHFTVADTSDVVKSEQSRPFVVHLRMLQEMLWCGPTCCDIHEVGSPPGSGVGPPAVTTEPPITDFVGVPEDLPRYEIVAAGIVKADGTSQGPVFNNLTASVQGSQIALNFRGYTVPNKTFRYVVKALLVFQAGTERAVVSFASFGTRAVGILMTVSNVTAEVLGNLELMVEISRYQAERVRPSGPPRPPTE